MNNQVSSTISEVEKWVTITRDLYEYLKWAFWVHFERWFLLFEKDGIISKAVESNKWNSPRTFGFSKEQLVEVGIAMERRGFTYIGTYHHHLDSDEKISNEKEGRLGEKYNPNQPSPSDIWVFKFPWYNSLALEDPTVQRLIDKVRFLLLWHKSQSILYNVQAYAMLNSYPENHPWKIYKEDIKSSGLMLDHYKWIDWIVHAPINILESWVYNDGDPGSQKEIQEDWIVNRIHEKVLDNWEKIRVLIHQDGRAEVELWSQNKVKRYWFGRLLQDWYLMTSGWTRMVNLPSNLTNKILTKDGLLLEVSEYWDSSTNKLVKFSEKWEILWMIQSLINSYWKKIEEIIPGNYNWMLRNIF